MLGEIKTSGLSEMPRSTEVIKKRESGLAARAEGIRSRDNQDKHADNDRFEAILKKIAGEDRKTDRDSEQTLDKLSEKVRELEEKIEALAKDPEKSKDVPVDEIKSALEKIKTLLENMKKTGSNMKLDFGNISVDLVQLLAEMVQKLTDSLNSQGGKEFLKLFKVLDDKISSLSKGHELGLKAGLASAQTGADTAKADNEAADSAAASQIKSDSEGKVKVVDKRTDQADTDPDAQKDNVLQAGSAGKNNILKSAIMDAQQQKPAKSTQDILKTDISPKGIETNDKTLNAPSENNQAQTIKADQNPGVFSRQYVSYSSTVSKANLEALMENITARALVTLRDGKSEIKMNLVPPELGKMNMKFTFEDGMLAGKIVVSTPEAKMLFDQNLGDLQRALQQAGINMGSLDVSLGQQDSGKAQDNADKGIQSQYNLDDKALVETSAAEDSERAHRLYDSSIYYVA